ncbi:MAG: 2,3-butanediol dehydrogenase [Deltaproteobacteria bacterium]|nr:2,3-butanediol dehydrogenase [Deltaproteobacteria bacterium]
MKAAVWHGKRDVRVEEVPEPPIPSPEEVKIKVHWCGICGSDLHEYLAGPIFIPVENPHPLTGKKAPVILGHEFSGEIAQIGEGVHGIQVGDRVTASASRSCGECFWCKRGETIICHMNAATGMMADGAFAEYVNVPAYNIYKLPEGVSFEEAALTEPLAVGVHAMRRARIKTGDHVVIVGAGTIGLSVLQATRASGAGTITVVEVAEARKEYAKKLGATRVLDPTKVDVPAEVARITDGVGADLGFECVGDPKTALLTLDSVRRGGKMVVLGVFERPAEINLNSCVFFEKQIIGSLGYNDEFSTVLSFLVDGRLQAKPMISGKIRLEDILEMGFGDLIEHKDQHIKILVSPL